MAWMTEDKRDVKVAISEQPVVSDGVRQKIKELFARYETKQAVLLPALHAVQHALGHIPAQAVVEVAELLELSPAQVADTISFYEEYFTEPKGRQVVMVCRSISCELMGSEAVIAAVKQKLGVAANRQSSPEGEFTFMEVECLAACDKGPCMMIDEQLYENLSAEQARRKLDEVESDGV